MDRGFTALEKCGVIFQQTYIIFKKVFISYINLDAWLIQGHGS
jgi:hypothetical protein